ncbi:MAG: hypothetical protein LUH19_05035 [Lachnospiraceae bacterium]|nr:hypothetical protein [Lachnospiraceae bacterium]
MKKWIRGILFVCAAVLVMARAYRILSWKDTAGNYQSSLEQLYNTGNDLMDVVFVGSSHVYCDINPSILWRDYGIAGFDMAVSGQDKDTAWHNLLEVLKTQSPKVVCVDLYALTYEKTAIQGNVYRATLSMDLSFNAVELILKEVENREEWADYILRWPIIHTRYRELERYDFQQYELSVFGRGQTFDWTIGWGAQISEECLNDTTVGELGEKNLEWLENLAALSEEKNFELILFIAPYYYESDCREIYNAAKQYAARNGIEVLDFNELAEEISLDFNRDYIDGAHCNSYGAEKVTAYFGQWLNEYMELTDHRGDSAYFLWEKDLEYYEQYAQEAILAEAVSVSMEDYVQSILKGNNLTCIITLNGDYMAYSDDIGPVMETLGMNLQDYPDGGKWLYADGQLQFIMDNNSTDAFIYDLDGMYILRMENLSVKEGADAFEDIQIDETAQETIYNGIGFIVYNTCLHRVISRIGYN